MRGRIAAITAAVALAVAVVVGSRARTPRPPIASDPPPSPPPSPSVDDGGAARARCLDVERRARAHLAARADGGGHVSAYVDALIGTCLVTPHGAWTFTITDVVPGADTFASLAFHVVHLDAGGAESTLLAATQEEGANPAVHNCCSVYGVTDLKVRLASDYDGDGEPELYLASVQTGDEGHHAEAHTLYTARGGAIAHLDAAERLGFVDLRDADGDGVLDLVLAPFVASDEGPCTGFPTNRTVGPLLLAHADGRGGFSTTDEVARAAARAACPQKPTRFATANDVACARVWGVGTSAIGAAFDRASAVCRKEHPAPDPDASCDVEDPCRTPDVLLGFARAVPRTVLGP